MDEHLLRFDKTKTLVFVDCETLNLCLNFCHNIPWQVAMLKCQGDNIIDGKDAYLKWQSYLYAIVEVLLKNIHIQSWSIVKSFRISLCPQFYK